MQQYFEAYKSEFLMPTEDNFSVLLEKMDRVQKEINSQVESGVPRIPLDERFSYRNMRASIPKQGKDSSEVLKGLARAFQGSARWHQPTMLVNIVPNPLLDSVAAASLSTLYNVNSLWDYMSGNVNLFEKEVVAFLAHMAAWDASKAEGVSTFGGKATLMYAIKCGLNECDRASVHGGLRGDYVVITSATAHYSIEDSCNYLGIGRNNVVRVATDETGAMKPAAFEAAFRKALAANKKIAAIILLGGDTLEHAVDPIEDIVEIRDRVVREMGLSYKPFVHLDSVNAWSVLAFRGYDFDGNPLGFAEETLKKLKVLYQRMSAISLVDSFSADFHKTGLAPYVSSYFVTRSAGHLHSINKSELLEDKPDYQYGELHTHHISFENSRSSAGILSAWVIIQRLGLQGFRQYWAQLIEVGRYIRNTIDKEFSADFRIVNTTALGHPNVIQLVPPELDIQFDALLSDSANLEAYSNYCFEFYEYMAYELMKQNSTYPLLGFVPSYKFEITGIKRPAYVIYQNNPHLTESDCMELLEGIRRMKRTFDKSKRGHRKDSVRRLQHLPK